MEHRRGPHHRLHTKAAQDGWHATNPHPCPPESFQDLPRKPRRPTGSASPGRLHRRESPATRQGPPGPTPPCWVGPPPFQVRPAPPCPCSARTAKASRGRTDLGVNGTRTERTTEAGLETVHHPQLHPARGPTRHAGQGVAYRCVRSTLVVDSRIGAIQHGSLGESMQIPHGKLLCIVGVGTAP